MHCDAEKNRNQKYEVKRNWTHILRIFLKTPLNKISKMFRKLGIQTRCWMHRNFKDDSVPRNISLFNRRKIYKINFILEFSRVEECLSQLPSQLFPMTKYLPNLSPQCRKRKLIKSLLPQCHKADPVGFRAPSSTDFLQTFLFYS